MRPDSHIARLQDVAMRPVSASFITPSRAGDSSGTRDARFRPRVALYGEGMIAYARARAFELGRFRGLAAPRRVILFRMPGHRAIEPHPLARCRRAGRWGVGPVFARASVRSPRSLEGNGRPGVCGFSGDEEMTMPTTARKPLAADHTATDALACAYGAAACLGRAA